MIGVVRETLEMKIGKKICSADNFYFQEIKNSRGSHHSKLSNDMRNEWLERLC